MGTAPFLCTQMKKKCILQKRKKVTFKKARDHTGFSNISTYNIFELKARHWNSWITRAYWFTPIFLNMVVEYFYSWWGFRECWQSTKAGNEVIITTEEMCSRKCKEITNTCKHTNLDLKRSFPLVDHSSKIYKTNVCNEYDLWKLPIEIIDISFI